MRHEGPRRGGELRRHRVGSSSRREGRGKSTHVAASTRRGRRAFNGGEVAGTCKREHGRANVSSAHAFEVPASWGHNTRWEQAHVAGPGPLVFWGRTSVPMS